MPTTLDFSVFDRFDFERQPVGIKYLLNRPDGLPRFDKSLAMCEIFKAAQDSEPFYADKDNFACLGSMVMGMKDPDPIFESGEIGATEGIFREARANRRIYPQLPKLARNSVRYVSFSPANKLTFDPDVLVITATVSQAEIILRALNYSSGKILNTRYSLVIMCAWLFIYPYISGEANFTVTGLGYGMKARKVLPEGLMLISIPFDSLTMLLDNLSNMEWVLTLYTANDDERAEYFKKTTEEIRRRYENG
jgi:uncharacterized protein (DUF169 family)